MNGWIGTILRINVATGSISKENLDPAIAQKFMGGRGLGTYIMSREVSPVIDPLDPDNKLIFAAGPLSGTNAPSSSHWNIVTKGPLTGTIAASSSGGMFGAMLKYAGYDARIVEGKAAKPIYIWIKDDNVEIRDASQLWGKPTPETTEIIRALTDEEASISCIGPAGENLTLLANIMNECNRAAGRSGVGAVMGSKNLKAVAVRGTGAVRVPDPKVFRNAMVKAKAKLKAHPVGGTGLRLFGTDVLINILNETGGLPTRNFRESSFANADKVGGESLAKRLLIRARGCIACTISCGRATKVTNPDYKGQGEGPEYETAWAFGPDCGVDDLDAIAKANYLCNEYGIDTIGLGATVACAMDLFEHGIITAEDTDGIALNFGNAKAMVAMVRKTAFGEGFGKKLGQGSYRLAESYGHPEYSMSVKKQEMPAYDPRAVQGMGLTYATSNRGGCHVRGYMTSVEILGNPVKLDNLTTEGKAQWDIIFQDLTAAIDSAGMCLFTTFGLGGDDLAELVSAATGVQYTTNEFLKTGARIWNLERLYNIKAGFTHKDDKLPPRMLEDSIQSGPAKGYVSKLDKMLPEYYALRGWDTAGMPTPERLESLELKAL
jgi:aldehyde:ferredoxin oxidoreductase